MVRTIAAAVYMVVWGIATVVLIVRGDPIPAEYWTLPAIGLGGLLTAMASIDKIEMKKKPKLDPSKEEPVKDTP